MRRVINWTGMTIFLLVGITLFMVGISTLWFGIRMIKSNARSPEVERCRLANKSASAVAIVTSHTFHGPSSEYFMIRLEDLTSNNSRTIKEGVVASFSELMQPVTVSWKSDTHLIVLYVDPYKSSSESNEISLGGKRYQVTLVGDRADVLVKR